MKFGKINFSSVIKSNINKENMAVVVYDKLADAEKCVLEMNEKVLYNDLPMLLKLLKKYLN